MTSAVVLERKQSINQDDVVHYWCCDEKVALCGVPLAEDVDEPTTCVVCIDLDEEEAPCVLPDCPWRE